MLDSQRNAKLVDFGAVRVRINVALGFLTLTLSLGS